MQIKNVGLLAAVAPDKSRINFVIYTGPKGSFVELEVMVVNQDTESCWFHLSFGTNDKLDHNKMVEYKRIIPAGQSFRLPALIVGPNQQLVGFAQSAKMNYIVMGTERSIDG